MQRFVTGLGRAGAPLVLAAPAAVVAAHPSAQNAAQPHAPSSPTRLALEETHDDDGFVNIGCGEPVRHAEVATALTDLSALGGAGVLAPRTVNGAHRAAALTSMPLIEEADSDSETSSEGGTANAYLAAADAGSFTPSFAAGGDAGDGPMDLLAQTVTNLLNNPDVINTISTQLMTDPAFMRFMNQMDGQLSLPAPARYMLLEEVEDEPVIVTHPGHQGVQGPHPLVALLLGIQRGVAVAAVRMGEAFCHLGNYLRRLGDSLSSTLADMTEGSAGASGSQRIANRSTHVAVAKVACAVAVLVLTRRVAVARMPV